MMVDAGNNMMIVDDDIHRWLFVKGDNKMIIKNGL